LLSQLNISIFLSQQEYSVHVCVCVCVHVRVCVRARACMCVGVRARMCLTPIIHTTCFVMYVEKKTWYVIYLPVYPFPQFEFLQNFVHPCTTGQPLIVFVFKFHNDNTKMAVT
jgi:hypothetical protein